MCGGLIIKKVCFIFMDCFIHSFVVATIFCRFNVVNIMTRKGRPKLSGIPLSRRFCPCAVPECSKAIRADNLEKHYRNQVVIDKNGDVRDPKKIQGMKRSHVAHTKFFFENNYSLTKLPPKAHYSSHEKPTNQAELRTFLVRAGKQKNQVADDENENSEEVDDPPDNEVEKEIEADSESDSFAGGSDSEKESFQNNAAFDVEMLSETEPEREKIPFLSACSNNNNVTSNDEDRLLKKFSEIVVCEFEKSVDKLMSNDKEIGTIIEDNWLEFETEIYCVPCTQIPLFPNNNIDSRQRKGAFGRIKKDQNRPYNTHKAKLTHEGHQLHKDMVELYEKYKKEKNTWEQMNRKCCEKVVLNAYFCLKNGLSAENFLRLNSLDKIKSDLSSDISANINTSRGGFFELRNNVFSKLQTVIKKTMKSVKCLSVTLDKVTVSRISYTVICSYFFYQGEIFVLLNKLHKMRSNDYSAKETADMMVLVLIETLGLDHEGKIYLREKESFLSLLSLVSIPNYVFLQV